jgi:hypothetical protein
LRAFHAEPNGHKRDEIAGRQVHVVEAALRRQAAAIGREGDVRCAITRDPLHQAILSALSVVDPNRASGLIKRTTVVREL